MLLLAGCNGSTKGCREPYRERKGILGISWRIESFKLIFPKYDDCRNPGIIAEDDWKLFLFDGVKNAGAELDYDLIEPQLPAGSPRPFSISEYEFEPGDFTALRLDNVCAKPGVRYCIEFKRKGSRPKATRVRVYLIVKPDVDWERRMMFPDDLAGQPIVRSRTARRFRPRRVRNDAPPAYRKRPVTQLRARLSPIREGRQRSIKRTKPCAEFGPMRPKAAK